MLTAKILGLMLMLSSVIPSHVSNLQVPLFNPGDITYLIEYLPTVFAVFHYQEYLGP
jgi:hypothetical protein